MKGASRTQLSILKKDAKGVEHTQKSSPMKDAKNTSASQGERNKASKEGTSHTQVRDKSKVAQSKAADDRTGSAERTLMEGQSMSQEAKEQLAKTLTQLARELSDSGGPLLSHTIDANHLACYLALEAEKNYLAPNMFSGDCEFTVMEMWQQCVELVRQSGGDDQQYVALVDEEWLNLQYCNLMRKRRAQSLVNDSEPLRTVVRVIKRWVVGAARNLQATKNLKGVKPGEASPALSKEKAVDTVSTGFINDGDRQ
jgi:hypothetical protein